MRQASLVAGSTFASPLPLEGLESIATAKPARGKTLNNSRIPQATRNLPLWQLNLITPQRGNSSPQDYSVTGK